LYGIARLARKSHGEAINIAIKSHYSGRLSINPPHPTSLEAEAYFGDAWKSYRKFAFVRNPFDRLASDYYWRFRATGKQITFAQYLRLLEIRDYRNGIIHPGAAYNWEMIANGQDIVVDLVGRYENLSQDLGIICKTLGLPLLRLGSSEKVNNANRNYGELYRAVEIATVERICANELHAFGYEFPYK
jgi:hypothetical protein